VSGSASTELLVKVYQRFGISRDQVFIKSAGEPRSDEVNRLGKQLQRISADQIVALGGGSTIDLAKAAGIVCATRLRIEDFEFPSELKVKAVPVIAMPTIPGSGSEATPYAVVTNATTNRKFTVTSERLLPKAILIDSAFLPALEHRQIVPSLLDAYCHALESVGNPSSPNWVHELGCSVMTRVHQFLLKDRSSLQMRLAIDTGTDGGRCIAAARTGLPHTLAVALAEVSPAPHGVLVAQATRALVRGGLLRSASPLDHCAAVLTETDQNAGSPGSGTLERLTDWFDVVLAESGFRSVLPLGSGSVTKRVINRVRQDKGLNMSFGGPVDFVQLEALVRSGDVDPG